MANKFSKGDIVVLKSGGPKMTVDDVQTQGDIIAIWFAGAKRERASFDPETSNSAPEDGKK